MSEDQTSIEPTTFSFINLTSVLDNVQKEVNVTSGDADLKISDSSSFVPEPVAAPVIEEKEEEPVPVPVPEPEPVAAPVIEEESKATVFEEPSNERNRCLVLFHRPPAFTLEEADMYSVRVLNSNRLSKWNSLLHYLITNDEWKNYRYVWMPDTTGTLTCAMVCSFFEEMHKTGGRIGQPSVEQCPNGYTHKNLIRESDQGARKAAFIESKYPCFERTFIQDQLLPFLRTNEKHLKSGWGIDLWWSKVATMSEMYVVDAIVVPDTCNASLMRVGHKEKRYFESKYSL